MTARILHNKFWAKLRIFMRPAMNIIPPHICTSSFTTIHYTTDVVRTSV
jgi:hypothetical protein